MIPILNRTILIGRLTRDPDLRYTPAGVATCTFTLAIDRPFAGSDGKREADFLNIVTWRQLAETCANYLKKGRLTAVEGRIQTRSYEKDGKRVYVTEIVADNVRFLEKSGQAQEGGGAPTGGNAQTRTDPFQDDGRPVDISDDDLPF